MKTIGVFERLIAAAVAAGVTLLVVASLDSIADGYVRPALRELPASYATHDATDRAAGISREKTASAPCIPERNSGG